MQLKSVHVVALALIARIIVIYYDQIANLELGRRPELVTPFSSTEKLNECLYLLRRGSNPYASQLCHQPPLLMALFFIIAPWGRFAIHGLFIAADLCIAAILYRLAGEYLKRNPYVVGEDKDLLLKTFVKGSKPEEVIPIVTAAVYLLNPWTIACNAACSLTVFENLALAASLLYGIQNKFGPATMWTAIAAYLGFYPIVFVVPLAVMFQSGKDLHLKSATSIRTLIATLLATGVWIATLLGLSYTMLSSWDFLNAVYGFILSVQDLTPNIGLYWYFNTEMFEFFRKFFLFVFHYNVFIYAIPLRARLPLQPFFVAFIIYIVVAAFKSYPSLAETGFYLAFLPIFQRTLRHVRYSYFVINVFVYTTVLRPVFWHMWIRTGTGNANFFWAVCLAFTLVQVWMMVDMIRSASLREVELENEAEKKTKKE